VQKFVKAFSPLIRPQSDDEEGAGTETPFSFSWSFLSEKREEISGLLSFSEVSADACKHAERAISLCWILYRSDDYTIAASALSLYMSSYLDDTLIGTIMKEMDKVLTADCLPQADGQGAVKNKWLTTFRQAVDDCL
jgi:hypothetical protein